MITTPRVSTAGERIKVLYDPILPSRRGAKRRWTLVVDGKPVKSARGNLRRFTSENLARNTGLKIIRGHKSEAVDPPESGVAEIARLSALLDSERRIAGSWKNSAEEIASQRDHWMKGCREWEAEASEARRRVAELEEQLRRSATVCPKDGCMLWKGHAEAHHTADELQLLIAAWAEYEGRT